MTSTGQTPPRPASHIPVGLVRLKTAFFRLFNLLVRLMDQYQNSILGLIIAKGIWPGGRGEVSSTGSWGDIIEAAETKDFVGRGQVSIATKNSPKVLR